MADSSYLQQLTEAEVKSNRIISAAHEARDKRIKEAKFDAEQEIA
jgi:vacuolar-type H+-ATPase subunit H